MKQSIFDGVVRNENAYTQLLCNLMEHNADFKLTLLSLLFSVDVAKKSAAFTLQTQRSLRESATRHGRPDIYLSTPEIMAIVEVKTSLETPATEMQSWEADENLSLQGYRSFLRTQTATELWFVYLIPNGWYGINKLNELRDLHDGRDDIRLKVVTWEDIFRAIDEPLSRDTLVEEFKLLLSKRFEPVCLTKSEVAMLKDMAALSALWKLNKIIRGLSAKAKSAGFIIEWEKDWKNSSEGFYFKKGKEYLLYFGSWLEFAKAANSPVCFGIAEEWGEKVVDSFLEAAPFKVVRFEDPKKWIMNSIPDELLVGDDATAAIWSKIQPLANSLSAHSALHVE